MFPKLIIFSSSDQLKNEIDILKETLEFQEVYALHIRKYNYSEKDLEKFINNFLPLYQKKIILHNHHHLVHKYKLLGFYLNRSVRKSKFDTFLWKLKKKLNKKYVVSTGAHSLEEVLKFSFVDYVICSPVFDSISKPGHYSRFSINGINLIKSPKLIALGGITPETAPLAIQLGFSGVAAYGYIWNNSNPLQALVSIIKSLKDVRFPSTQ